MEQKAETWREQRVTIKPSTSEIVYFYDTKPNHILISNNAPVPVFVGIGTIASATTYDMIVPGYGTRMFPRITGVEQIYLYTESNEDVTLQITSWEGDFNPASIPQSQEVVSGSVDGVLGIVNVNNFMNPLPSGNNHIGQISIANFNNPLPEGDNHIGYVSVSNQINYNDDIGYMIELLYNMTGYLQTISEGSGVGGGTASPKKREIIEHIINDDEEITTEPYESNLLNIAYHEDIALHINAECQNPGSIELEFQTDSFSYNFTRRKTIGTYTIPDATNYFEYLTAEELPFLKKGYLEIYIIVKPSANLGTGLTIKLIGTQR